MSYLSTIIILIRYILLLFFEHSLTNTLEYEIEVERYGIAW